MAGLVPAIFLGRPQAPRFKEERHDWAAEKRAALDAWAAHVLVVAEGRASAGNVVTLAPAWSDQLFDLLRLARPA